MMHKEACFVPSGAYKRYLLMLLTVILLFNYVDRMALGIVLEDIKVDLALTDTELGFLSGIAFALFYSLMGVPIARWADRGHRVVIVAVTAALWSVAVALCGVANSFTQLLLIRVAVAVGEAGCVPPAYSLLADYFDRAERPRAAAIYGLGGPLSFVVGYFVAGWLNELHGWRTMFIMLGLPGLVLAALTWATLKEPRCIKPASGVSSSARSEPPALPAISLKEVWVTLWAITTFRQLLFSLSVIFFFVYGVLQWLPTFFVRGYGLTSAQIGTWLAMTVGIGGLAGTYLGGVLASRYAANDECLQLKAMSIVIAVAGVLSSAAYLAPNQYWVFGLMGLFFLAQTTINGPLFATLQTLVPERMRAVAFALVYLFANLIGMGIGPLAVGVLSDAFRPWGGEESLRYALMLLGPGYFVGAWFLWRGSRTVTRDIDDIRTH